MEKDFELDLGIELVQGGTVYDLHNCYYFSGLMIGSEQSVVMSFVPDPVHGTGKAPLILRFDHVDYLEFSPGFGTRDLRDLDEIGYKSPDDRNVDWLQSESQSESGDHLLFRVGSSDFIRIHCQRVLLLPEESGLASPTSVEATGL